MFHTTLYFLLCYSDTEQELQKSETKVNIKLLLPRMIFSSFPKPSMHKNSRIIYGQHNVVCNGYFDKKNSHKCVDFSSLSLSLSIYLSHPLTLLFSRFTGG